MKIIKQLSLLLFTLWMHSAVAYQNTSLIKNVTSDAPCIDVINNSNDAYMVNIIYYPNKSGKDWTPYYLHPMSYQPFCYASPLYYGIYFKIDRVSDGYEFYYGNKSSGEIIIPAN